MIVSVDVEILGEGKYCNGCNFCYESMIGYGIYCCDLFIIGLKLDEEHDNAVLRCDKCIDATKEVEL